MLAKRAPPAEMLAALTLITSIRSDHSTSGVIDRKGRVARRGKIAGEIKDDIGAADDVPADEVVDISIKRADR